MAGTHAAANAALNLALGARIQVFWPLDVAWCATAAAPVAARVGLPRGRRYTGTITSLEGMRGMVEYDDGAPAARSRPQLPSALHPRGCAA